MGGGGDSKRNQDEPWLQIAFAILGEVTGPTGTAVQLKLPDPSSAELEHQLDESRKMTLRAAATRKVTGTLENFIAKCLKGISCRLKGTSASQH